MKNITNEVQENTSTVPMPSIKDFSSAKIQEGFSFLGSKFGQGKRKLELEKSLLEIKAKLNSSTAREIGKNVIAQIEQGQDIIINEDLINQVNNLLIRKRQIEGELKNV